MHTDPIRVGVGIVADNRILVRGAIRCGDSLFGVYDLEVLREGIPDAAYKPLSGDDKVIARDFEKRNKAQRTGQGTLFGAGRGLPSPPPLAGAVRKLRALPEDDSQQVAEKRRRFAEAENDAQRWNWRQAANAYIAAFVIPKTKKEAPSLGTATIPTTEDVFHQISGDSVVYGPRVGRIQELADVANPFHWPLEFPDIMERGGFDVVLGNPPWERIKIQEQEFFASREPEIATAPNAAARSRMIAALREADEGTRERSLFSEFETAKRIAEASSVFARLSEEDHGRFPLTGRGDVNTYALFAELFATLASHRGRAGVIVPMGIATDATTSIFFGAMITGERLVSLISFENEEFIFPSVHHAFRFSLLTLAKSGASTANFSFFLRQTSQLSDPRRRFQLSPAEIGRLNPNTKTAPIFRSQADAELTARIYARVPILWDENQRENGNLWGISFMRMFDMANDSGLFQTAEQLRASGFVRTGRDWQYPDGKSFVPMYEAKLVHQFTHRWATYDGEDVRDFFEGELENSEHEAVPKYWVDSNAVQERLRGKNWVRGWLIGWRDITGIEKVRTLISAAVPATGWGHKLLLLFPDAPPRFVAALYGCLNSLVCDYCARQKVGGTGFGYFTFKQLPVLPPTTYSEAALNFIVPRVLELTYTSHSMAPFAHDLGYDGLPFGWEEERRALLRAELDAWYARAYGLTRDELRYVLDPADVRGEDYPSETFRVLKNSDMKRFGKYRTQELVLEAWDRLEKGDTVVLPIAKPLPHTPISTDLLRDNSWATASDLPAYTVTQLAAVVHGLPGPTPIARVRVAALFALEPQLLTRHLSSKGRATWLRLVGSAARASQVGNVLSFTSKIDLSWGRAVTQLRGMGELAEDLNAGTWAAGTPVSQYAIDGWAVGRAEFVLGALAGISIDVLTADLSPEDRAWVNAAYVA